MVSLQSARYICIVSTSLPLIFASFYTPHCSYSCIVLPYSPSLATYSAHFPNSSNVVPPPHPLTPYPCIFLPTVNPTLASFPSYPSTIASFYPPLHFYPYIVSSYHTIPPNLATFYPPLPPLTRFLHRLNPINPYNCFVLASSISVILHRFSRVTPYSCIVISTIDP